MAKKISIIIPMLNEMNSIKRIFYYIINRFLNKNIEEIIVVDGGSYDSSQKVVSKFKNVVLLEFPKGRAKQMNLGAKMANGSILYFLHADSLPPKNFDQQIVNEVVNGANVGCFILKFDKADHFLLKISQWLTRINFQLFRGGDQSLSIEKDIFNQLHGFNEDYIIFEDIEIISRLYKTHKFVIINDYIITAVRKFKKNGVWKLHFNFLIIHIKNMLGASANDLYRYYVKHIK